MIAIEFKSKIKNNRIAIPAKIQSKFKSYPEKDVRVILFFEEHDEINEETDFKRSATLEFLNGYNESDSVYDNYQ